MEILKFALMGQIVTNNHTNEDYYGIARVVVVVVVVGGGGGDIHSKLSLEKEDEEKLDEEP